MDYQALIQQAIAAMSWWEVAAVFLGVAYLLLAMYEKISCWYAALGSTIIYTFLFWNVNLFMESALQIYYIAMAVYGWWQWRQPTEDKPELPITKWGLKKNVLAIGLIIILTLISGTLLSDTSAAWPYADSFTTWGAVVTTYMVTRKVLENWYYWLVVDSVAMVLYFDRELYLTALLFLLYLIIVMAGVVKWHRLYKTQ